MLECRAILFTAAKIALFIEYSKQKAPYKVKLNKTLVEFNTNLVQICW